MGNLGFFDVTYYWRVFIQPERENNSLAYSNYVLKSQRTDESSNLYYIDHRLIFLQTNILRHLTKRLESKCFKF